MSPRMTSILNYTLMTRTCNEEAQETATALPQLLSSFDSEGSFCLTGQVTIFLGLPQVSMPSQSRAFCLSSEQHGIFSNDQCLIDFFPSNVTANINTHTKHTMSLDVTTRVPMLRRMGDFNPTPSECLTFFNQESTEGNIDVFLVRMLRRIHRCCEWKDTKSVVDFTDEDVDLITYRWAQIPEAIRDQLMYRILRDPFYGREVWCITFMFSLSLLTRKRY